MCVSKLKLI